MDFIKQCLVKDQELRPSVHDMLRHPWLNQVEDENLLAASSFIDNRMANTVSFKEGTLDKHNPADFAKLLFGKMSWVSQS